MDSSTVLPLTPSVDTTTLLFSLISRSVLPRQRTTTWMLVSSPVSCSKSLSFRFTPAVDCSLGDLKARAPLVAAGFMAPPGDCDRSVIVRRVVGRIAVLLVAIPVAGLCGPAMMRPDGWKKDSLLKQVPMTPPSYRDPDWSGISASLNGARGVVQREGGRVVWAINTAKGKQSGRARAPAPLPLT